MTYHFSRVGDQIPNSNGEIHLEPQGKKEIWEEYVEMSKSILHEDSFISYPSFLRLWNVAFEHVKIRIYKQANIFIRFNKMITHNCKRFFICR
jgi:hypothetical protein